MTPMAFSLMVVDNIKCLIGKGQFVVACFTFVATYLNSFIIPN